MAKVRNLVAAVACLGLLCAGPQNAALETWLKAYNAGDDAALTKIGDDSLAYAKDSREETGGLDLVRVENDDGSKISALLKEHDSSQLWRIKVQRDNANPSRFGHISYVALPVTQEQSLTALDRFATKLDARNEFSGVLAIAKGGVDIYNKAFGFADETTKAPVTLDTRFYFASQGKMFTAVSVLQLVEARKLGLDDPIGRYLTDYPNQDIARKVTIRHLLMHRGGTGEMGILEPQDGANRAWVRGIADIIRLNGTRGPAFEPGSKFDYSNYGYILLGAAIEKASGEDYYDYVQEHVFKPAGMTHTDFPLREVMGGIAVPYTRKNGELGSAMDQWPWRGTPAGGGVSTASDMLRFAAALKSGKLISPKILAEATSSALTPYGYGFIVSDGGNLPYWGHGGGAPGDSLVLDVYPTTNTTFVCMSNRDPPVCDRLAFNFLFRSPRASAP